jgi:hypothetical protein
MSKLASYSITEEERQISAESQEDIRKPDTNLSSESPEYSVEQRRGTARCGGFSSSNDLFYETQLNNDELTWQLWTKTDKGGSVLIDKGILTDPEISIGVGHSYNEGMSDPFGGIIKGVLNTAKSFSPYINTWTNGAKKGPNMLQSLAGIFGGGKDKENNMVNNIIDTVGNAIDTGGKFLNDVVMEATGKKMNFEQAINGQFLSAFDMIKTFTGSEVAFNLPRLETVWIHGLNIKDVDFTSIQDRFDHVSDHILGDVVTMSNGAAYGLQLAPNNYRPEYKGLSQDEQPMFRGTFSLLIGTQYRIDNLILKSFQYHPSLLKAMGSNGSPLYATVSYDLEPASFITKGQLRTIARNQVRVMNTISEE